MPRQRTLKLTKPEREKLSWHRTYDKRAYVRERCAALLKIASGRSAHWVAHHGLVKARAPDTLYNWLDIYEEEGLKGLVARRHGGYRQSCL